MNAYIEINGCCISPGGSVYGVADMSAKQNQDFDKAVKIINATKDVGANTVKLQTYAPDAMTIDVGSELFHYGKGAFWEGRNLYDLYSEAYTP